MEGPEKVATFLLALEPQLAALDERVAEQVEIEARYHGYLERERMMAQRLKALEATPIPRDIDYRRLSGLSREMVERLERIRPVTLGQAARIPGITPAATAVLQVHLCRRHTGER